MDPPNFLVRLMHSVPHLNMTFQHANSTFDPQSSVYVESLGILASIPAAILILVLVGLLLYLLTRCCDRKPRKYKPQSCQKCTLITVTLFCCAAIGLGLYGNDDFHNGLFQTLAGGRQIKLMVFNFTNKTSQLKHDIRDKVLSFALVEILEKPTYNQTGLKILLEHVRFVQENATLAEKALEIVLRFLDPGDHRSSEYSYKKSQDYSLPNLIKLGEFYESIRWPLNLGFFTILLLLCTILIIGVARSSRCALIFFSVFGLFGVISCWILSGIYLASSVALGDFCMKPNDYLCHYVGQKDVNFLNCGILRKNFFKRLDESSKYIDRARSSFTIVSSMSSDLFPRTELRKSLEPINMLFSQSHYELDKLMDMMDQQLINQYYSTAMRGLCNGGLFGLSLMMVASLLSAILLSILVCVDSHTWIYLSKRSTRRSYIDKSETTPILNSSASTASPTQINFSGSSTINRTLLHHHQQQQQPHSTGTLPLTGSSGGTAGLANHRTNRGLKYCSGDSPPPDYNIVVHDNNRSSLGGAPITNNGSSSSGGHHTLGRLPTQQHSHLTASSINGKYATLNKQCKILESNDFY